MEYVGLLTQICCYTMSLGTCFFITDTPANQPSLAGNSSDEDDEDSIAKYRQLLLGGGDKSDSRKKKTQEAEEESDDNDDIDMEITWDTGQLRLALYCIKSKT